MSGESLEANVAALTVEVKHLRAEVRELAAEQKRLTGLANRWKGAFGVILLFGASLGWLVPPFISRLLGDGG